MKKRRLVYGLVLGLCLLLLGTAALGRDGLLAVIVNQSRIENLQSEIGELEEGNRLLRNQIRSLRKDLTSVERIAREDLGLVKPGETVYEFIPVEKSSGRR
jgi:cell division protein FtsB